MGAVRLNITDEMMADVRARLVEGESSTVIAADYNMSTGSVSRIAQMAGIRFIQIPGDDRRRWHPVEDVPPELLTANEIDEPVGPKAIFLAISPDPEEALWAERLTEMADLIDQAEAKIEELSTARRYQFEKAHELERRVKELEEAILVVENLLDVARADIDTLTPDAESWRKYVADQRRESDRTGAREAYTRAGSVIERMKGLLGA